MATLTLISVGTLKEDYLKQAVAEYKKRLSQYAKVEEISLKEEAIKNEDDPSEIKRAQKDAFSGMPLILSDIQLK